MSIPNNAVHEVGSVTDKYGDTRRVYRQGQRGPLKVEKVNDTVSHHMSRVASVLIGARIKERRLAARLSLEDLCQRAGLSAVTPKNRMWEIENAIRGTGTRMGTLYAIAAALRCEVSDLVPPVSEVMALAGVAPTAVVTLNKA